MLDFFHFGLNLFLDLFDLSMNCNICSFLMLKQFAEFFIIWLCFLSFFPFIFFCFLALYFLHVPIFLFPSVSFLPAGFSCIVKALQGYISRISGSCIFHQESSYRWLTMYSPSQQLENRVSPITRTFTWNRGFV